MRNYAELKLHQSTALAEPLALCSHARMERLDPATLDSAILTAPGWVRVGITATVQRIREQAAHELARSLCEAMYPSGQVDRDQLRLPL